MESAKSTSKPAATSRNAPDRLSKDEENENEKNVPFSSTATQEERAKAPTDDDTEDEVEETRVIEKDSNDSHTIDNPSHTDPPYPAIPFTGSDTSLREAELASRKDQDSPGVDLDEDNFAIMPDVPRTESGVKDIEAGEKVK